MYILLQIYLSLFIAIVIGSAAFHKFKSPLKTAQLITSYGFSGTVFIAKTIATIEAITVLLLIISICFSGVFPFGAIAAALLFLFYAGVMTQMILKGRFIADCGCGWGNHEVPVSLTLVIRNIILAATIIGVSFPSLSYNLSFFDHLNGVFFTVFLLISYYFFEIWTAVNHMAKTNHKKLGA